MSQATAPAQHCVLRPDQIKSHDRGGGARTTPLVLPSVGATTFINGITEFAPGTKIPFHSHNCEESVVLLEGHAYMDIEGEVHELKPLDTTFIPPNVPHRFRNKSDTAADEDPVDLRLGQRHAHAGGHRRDAPGGGRARPLSARQGDDMGLRFMEHLLILTHDPEGTRDWFCHNLGISKRLPPGVRLPGVLALHR